MKLSLDELKVDSYAVQVSEIELADVKGGTTPGCAAAWVAWDVIVGIGTLVAAGAAVKSCSDSKPEPVRESVKVNVTDSVTTVIHGSDTIVVRK